MSLTILNSISSLVAENSLDQTAAGLQKSLQQLSSGLKINSSADDAAGLAIADGLQANTTALAQSYTNVNDGISFLQVADGALSQVNSLLNRAVTLATESASGELTGQQRSATNTEYQSILTEIDQIGNTTQFNGTQVFTDGLTSPVQLANGGSTVTSTINPADTLSGSFTVTSTIPGTGNPPSDIQLTDSGGTSTTGNITPGDTLSGSITITSKTSEIDGVGEALSFTASGDGSTLTSDPIIAGDTLSGSLVVNSAGGNASGSETINLANYQGLASSDSATATAAANQLAADMTTALGATTGSTYSASISGGVLTIQTSNPVSNNHAPLSIPFQASPLALNSDLRLYAGASLAGSFSFTSTGAGTGGSATIDLANYQGLTSTDPATQAAALTSLGNYLTTNLGATTGSTYTAGTGADGDLFIQSYNTNERFQIGVSNATETPATGTQNVALTGGGPFLNSIAVDPSSVASGMLNLSVTGPDGTATASINLANGYSDIFGSDSNAWNEWMNLQSVLSTDFASTGADVQVMGVEGSLLFQVDPMQGNSISDNGSTIQATLSGGETLSVDGSSSGFQAAIIPATSTPNTISLTGQTTAGLQSYLQTQLGSDYTVTYDNTSDSNSGDLTIALNSGNTDGYTSFTSSSSAQQTDGTPPVISSTSVSLAGLTKTNLASSLLTQLGGDYTVSYDQNSGALSIGISSERHIRGHHLDWLERQQCRGNGAHRHDGSERHEHLHQRRHREWWNEPRRNRWLSHHRQPGYGQWKRGYGFIQHQSQLPGQLRLRSRFDHDDCQRHLQPARRGRGQHQQAFGYGERHRDRADQSDLGIELHHERRHRQSRCQYDPIQHSAIDRNGLAAAGQPGAAGCIETAPVTLRQERVSNARSVSGHDFSRAEKRL